MKHYHILKRVKMKATKDLFMCADPECNWTRRREYLHGKKFRCPLCGGTYIASTEVLRLKIPHCINCTIRKDLFVKIQTVHPTLISMTELRNTLELENEDAQP